VGKLNGLKRSQEGNVGVDCFVSGSKVSIKASEKAKQGAVSKRLNVQVEAKLYQELKLKAVSEGQTISSLVNTWIVEFVRSGGS